MAWMAKKAQLPGAIRFDLEERSTYRFWLLVTQMQQCLAHLYVARFGRPANAWKVVTVVGRRTHVAAAEVVRQTNLEPDKVTRIVDRLVAQGLMQRAQESEDRRRVRLSLTAAGRRVYRELDDIRRAIEIDFLGALSPEERDTLYGLLDKLQARAATIFSGREPWNKYVCSPDQAKPDVRGGASANRALAASPRSGDL